MKDSKMSQREKLKNLIIKFCNQEGNRTFTLKQINNIYGNFDDIGIGGKTPQATVRRLLQELRDEQFISFLDQSGCYTLRGLELLESEKMELGTINLSNETPEKKEYLIETYIRKTSWAKKAKEIFGSYCLINDCNNTYINDIGERYIEVHHIIPLYCGGEDAIWNLSVLCAHHHRMAHFSNSKDKKEIEQFLLNEVKNKIPYPL